MSLMGRLIRHRNTPGLRRIAREVAILYGCDIPAQVQIGRNFEIAHRGMGTVVHPRTIIGDDVTIYHGVTIGNARLGGPIGHIFIGDGATISAGAVIVTGAEDRRVGAGAVIAANAVVICDVPPGEVWGGVPAQRLSGLQR